MTKIETASDERVERVRSTRAGIGHNRGPAWLDEPEPSQPATPKRKYTKRPSAPVTRLLLSRAQAAQALSVSISTIVRMEMAGDLTPIKLNRSARGKTFLAAEEVEMRGKSGVR